MRELHFFLAPGLNYALVRYEFLIDGQPTQTVTGDDFREIVPTVWFPFEGVSDPHGRPSPKGGRMQPTRFQVTEAQANSGIPDSYFDIEFHEGDNVTDLRVGNGFRYVFGKAPEK